MPSNLAKNLSGCSSPRYSTCSTYCRTKCNSSSVCGTTVLWIMDQAAGALGQFNTLALSDVLATASDMMSKARA